jgi:hypothetical protein
MEKGKTRNKRDADQPGKIMKRNLEGRADADQMKEKTMIFAQGSRWWMGLQSAVMVQKFMPHQILVNPSEK